MGLVSSRPRHRVAAAIFRSTSPGVGINSTLVATIPSQNTTIYTDTGLALDTVYYYRVYAVTPYGAFSADSANESLARTLNHPAPFPENFEKSLVGWNRTGTWGVTTNGSHGGTYCLTETNAPYAGNQAAHDMVPGPMAPDTSLGLTLAGELNLTNAVNPQLTFWVRGHLLHYSGFRVQVSTDGGLNWPELGAAKAARR